MKFFDQVFDAPVEIVIAMAARVAAFSLAAITIDPTEPRRLAVLVAATLIMYAAYAVVLLGALHRRYVRNPSIWLIHAGDLLIVAILLSLTDGFSSPFPSILHLCPSGRVAALELAWHRLHDLSPWLRSRLSLLSSISQRVEISNLNQEWCAPLTSSQPARSWPMRAHIGSMSVQVCCP